MRKATERYNTKVEIPICIILDTIFNNYNNDVELLCRQALKYGFIDFDDKTKEYVLQKDYKEQDLYTVLDKEERKQYDLENELIEKGKKLEKEYRHLQQKINKVASDLGHELYGHILQNDEESWNEEYYTDGKLDYRKLLIDLLEEVFEILEVDGSKWYNYE